MVEWKSGQVILGEYTIEKELGRGGMGRVWLVKSNSTGRRFAVKQSLLKEEKHRKAFLAELQTWIDLPEHPNIVACRFFRTVGDDVLIFADYVEGGSLKNWIDSGRLYEGDRRVALQRVLDTAIQFAWGLHNLHELGLVHQDVKPGNVLMSDGDGAALYGMRAQVSDYGLARARARSSAQDVQVTGEGSILLSSGGYTPAYCSPEQAKGLPITRKTDIWSWGVSVLEMFTGGVTWHSGHLVGAVLDQYVEDADDSSGNLPMPSELVRVLKGCFQNDPAKRWANLGEVVDHLTTAYLNITGEKYTRDFVQIVCGAKQQTGVCRRRTASGVKWTDPRHCLEIALHLVGRDPTEAKEMLERSGGSRRGQLVADMAVFEEAKRIYLELVNKGRSDLKPVLAALCEEKAFVHETATDMPGALVEYDQSIAIWQRLVEQEGRRELANELAKVLMNKANALRDLGDLAGAVKLCDQGIGIWRRLVEQEGRREFADELTSALINKAILLGLVGDLAGAVKSYDPSIEIYRRLVEQEGRRDLADKLASALMGKANALRDLGDLAGAVKLCDQGIAIWRRLVEQEGRWELADHLAAALMNKGMAMGDCGDLAGAVKSYDSCIEIYRRLVEQEGRQELANELALALMDKAIALAHLGRDLAGAVKLYGQSIAIFRRLVEQEGRRELANDLALALRNTAMALADLGGDPASAMVLYDQSIAIFRRLVEQEGRRDLAEELALTLRSKDLFQLLRC